MWRLRTILTCTSLVLLLPGTAPAQEAPRPGDIARGEALAEEMCSRCHAIGLEGESPLADAPPFREVVTRYPVEHLQEALAEGIVVAHDAPMPEFELPPEEIDDLLAYLGQLERR
ncbi:c-type cytochrome [Lutibaculum baratangense]|uniref:Cytochrome c domain-containing protein n=1 Tax=Lutibaculum baratangense AMV1 TaxID=631454 RepID=V4TI99_9HYPH|nr:cytochrome c [Lutibaculum baratangense]ESR25728.1 hypothetical protein N177_1561 [Lutibaculum baratangense AMV1]